MAVLRRDRIVRHIEASLDRGIAVLVAPAGYGKTEAIVSAYGDIAITIDLRQARGPEAVARALTAAAAPRSLRGLSDLIARERDEDWEAELVAWVAKRLRPVETPIVIDDFDQFNEDVGGVRFLTAVIEATTPNVRWLIASRESPNLPIGTWVARDIMTIPLFADELAFSEAEAFTLAELLDPDGSIDRAAVSAIRAESEGWPFMLRLALSHWSRTRAVPLHLHTREMLFDFIEAEVWEPTSPRDRVLLQRLAALDRVPAHLFDELEIPNARTLLERLSRKNPLVRRTMTGEFTLHDLFRDFVTARHSNPELQDETLRAAVAAELARGAPHAALGLATRAASWPLVQRLLHEHGLALVEDGDRADVTTALRELPARFRTPTVRLLRGLLFVTEGREAAAEGEIRPLLGGDLVAEVEAAGRVHLAGAAVNRADPTAALDLLEPLLGTQRPETRADLLSEGLCIAAAAAAMQGSAETARAHLARARARLESVAGIRRAVVAYRIAFAEYYLGDWGAAEQDALTAVDFAEAHGMPLISAKGYALLQAVAASTQADTVLTNHYTQAWVRAARESGQRMHLALGLAATIAVSSDRGDDAAYDDAWKELRLLNATLPTRYTFHLRYAKTIHDIGLGRMRDALTAMTTLSASDLPATAAMLYKSLLALLYIANGKTDEAGPLLRFPLHVIGQADAETKTYTALAAIYRALALWLSGHSYEAGRVASGRLDDLIERDVMLIGVMRSVVQTAPATLTQEKFAQLTAPLEAMEFGGFARFLRSLFSSVVASSGMRCPLTPAQLDIVRLLGKRKSLEEIATELGKKRRTVEWHIEEACERLDVRGRAALVAVAVERGWVS